MSSVTSYQTCLDRSHLDVAGRLCGWQVVWLLPDMQAAVGWVARLLPDMLYLAVVGKVQRGMLIVSLVPEVK